MPALSAGDLAILRRPLHAIKDLTLNIFTLSSFATAKINQVSFTYPVAEITVDTTSADWTSTRGGQLVRITSASGALVYEGALRRNAGASTLYIAPIALGDSGKAVDQPVELADDQDITVYSAYVPQSYLSRFNPADPTEIYKRYDVAYNSGAGGVATTQYPDPKVNIGPWQAGTVDSGTGVLRVTLSASSSFSWTGGTLTYSWELPTGVSLVAGYALTDATIEVDCDPGQHVVLCAVDDDTTTPAQTQRGITYIFANDDSTYKPIAQDFDIRIVSDIASIEAHGREITFEIRGSNIGTRVWRGAPVLLTETPIYSNDNWASYSTPSAGYLDTFCGFIREIESVTTDGDVDKAVFRAVSPMTFFKDLPIAPQEVYEESTVTSWLHVHPDISHVAYIAYYMWKYHSPVIDQLFNLEINDTNQSKRSTWQAPGGSITDGVQAILDYILGHVTSRSDGTTVLARNPLLLPESGDRSAVASVISLADTDIRPPFTYNVDEVMTTGETEGYYAVYGAGGTSTIYQARMGYTAQMQGVDKARTPDFIADTQTDGELMIGHWHQRLNSPVQPFPIKIRGNMDVFEVANLEWVTLNVSGYEPIDAGLASARGIITRVERVWDFSSGDITKDITVTFQPETFGEEAVNVPATSGVGAPDTFDSPLNCQNFDFTVSDYGWADARTPTYSTYVASTGWQVSSATPGTPTEYAVAIYLDLDGKRAIKSVTLTYESSANVSGSYFIGLYASTPTGEPDASEPFYYESDGLPDGGAVPKASGTHVEKLVYTGTTRAQSIQVMARSQTSNTMTITGVKIKYYGDDAFSTGVSC